MPKIFKRYFYFSFETECYLAWKVSWCLKKIARDLVNNVDGAKSHVPHQWASVMSSWQNVSEHCHPGKMWPSIVILAKCGRAWSSWQNVSEHCLPGKMCPSIVFLAKCGQAWLIWQNVAKHGHPGKMWPSIVMKQNYDQTGKVNAWPFLMLNFYLTFKIKFCKKWWKINKEDTSIIKYMIFFFYNY